MIRDIHVVAREACLWLPETAETSSHGSASFRVRGKTFAYYTVNHHGDGRIAFLLNMPPGAQQHYVALDARRFFVPAYVGSRGWLGVQLDRGLPWSQVVGLVREAYLKVAPRDLRGAVPPAPTLKPPSRKLSAGEIDPLKARAGKAALAMLRRLCDELPETREALQFGRPVWKVRNKTFAWLFADAPGIRVCVRVGAERQGVLAMDPRFTIPAYLGHNGWIALALAAAADRDELRALLWDSYRHFAPRRYTAMQ